MRFTFFFTYLDNDQIFTMSIYFLYDWEKIKVFLWLKKGKKNVIYNSSNSYKLPRNKPHKI